MTMVMSLIASWILMGRSSKCHAIVEPHTAGSDYSKCYRKSCMWSFLQNYRGFEYLLFNLSCKLWSTDTPVPCRVWCPTRVCVSVRHRHDTRVTFYILDITGVHMSVSVSCSMFVSVLVLHRLQVLSSHVWLMCAVYMFCAAMAAKEHWNFLCKFKEIYRFIFC